MIPKYIECSVIGVATRANLYWFPHIKGMWYCKMTNKKVLQIDVTSDLACPWCYVGYKRLQNAIDKFKDAMEVELRWHPYMIDMQTKREGEDYMAYNRRRWGSDGWVSGMKRDALADGCKFENWGRQNPRSVWAHTLEAHRLLNFFRENCGWKMQGELKALLFDEYYEKGANISLVDELVRIGKKLLARAGVTDEGLVTKLEGYMRRTGGSDEGTAHVLSEDKRAKKSKGISGVPHFELLGQSAGGARDTNFWIDVFTSIVDTK